MVFIPRGWTDRRQFEQRGERGLPSWRYTDTDHHRVWNRGSKNRHPHADPWSAEAQSACCNLHVKTQQRTTTDVSALLHIQLYFPWSIIRRRPVESHSGARGNFLAGPPNIFMGPLWGENYWFFSFQNGAFWCTLYFWATSGPPNVQWL